MPAFDLTILYVADPLASAAFYERRLGRAPSEASPGFVMFGAEGGGALGLWRRDAVTPAAAAPPGGGELCVHATGIDALHAAWTADGVAIAQPPVTLEFGRSFVALDPDGHRLRVLDVAG